MNTETGVIVQIIGQIVGLEGRIEDFCPPYREHYFASVSEIEPYMAEHYCRPMVYRII